MSKDSNSLATTEGREREALAIAYAERLEVLLNEGLSVLEIAHDLVRLATPPAEEPSEREEIAEGLLRELVVLTKHEDAVRFSSGPNSDIGTSARFDAWRAEVDAFLASRDDR